MYDVKTKKHTRPAHIILSRAQTLVHTVPTLALQNELDHSEFAMEDASLIGSYSNSCITILISRIPFLEIHYVKMKLSANNKSFCRFVSNQPNNNRSIDYGIICSSVCLEC
jgi:hypothetical protein